MDQFSEYMRDTASSISLLETRVTSLEQILSRFPGLGMEEDPTRVPVIIETPLEGSE